MAAEKEKIVLEGQEAIDLWLKGKDAWNKWVEENPVADVNFKGQRFQSHTKGHKIQQNRWPFAGYKFPDGDVDFHRSIFVHANISFCVTSFGKGNVNFSEADFTHGYADFGSACFGDGDVNFNDAKFGHRGLSLNDAQFGKGNVYFNFINIDGGNISFLDAWLGEGNYSFENIDFTGRVVFSGFRNSQAVCGFSFQYSSFEKSLDIYSHEPFGCVVDLTRTRTTHQVSLEGLECTVQTENGSLFSEAGAWFKKIKASDPADRERLRRLKELAENNRDHKKAIDFHVMEMQAARWHGSSFADLFFEFWYQKLGDYGRSEIRPICWMIGVWAAFACIYAWLSNTALGFWNKLPTALTFSAGQMFPFIPSSRDARIDSAKTLFTGEQLPNLVYGFTFAQSLISIALLFLLGLALRNRFRV